MRLTAMQLRRIIRGMLLEQDAGQSASSPAADQAHKQLESQPVNDANLMVKGDATYTALIKKHPKAQAGIDSVFAMFETARQNRLSYLRGSFAERYEALQKKLNTGTNIDVEKLKQAMISRVEKSQIKMGTYGSEIRANHDDSTYTPLKDTTSGWLKNLGSRFAVSTSADEYHVIAYAPRSEALVVTEPPDLKMSVKGEVEAAIPSKDILSTLEHELIHQEDHAADLLLGISQYGGIGSAKGGAAEFATRLIRQAMVPEDQMTVDFIRKRLSSNSMTANILATAAGAGFNLEANFAWFALFPTAAAAISLYSDLLNGYPNGYRVFYYTLEKELGKTLRTLDPDSEEFKKVYDTLWQYSGKQGYKLREIIRDYQLDTHLRITLSLLLPHLQKALAEKTDPAATIESALTSMNDANQGDDVRRAAFILAVTDPKKLADLTMVALGGSKQKGAPGRPEDQTALAENVRRRWSRIAGLI